MDDAYLEAGPVTQFEHTHPSLKNVDAEFEQNRTHAQILADIVASIVGSWPFIIIQSILLVIWIAVNVVLAMKHSDKAWDPYPFILLNLALSFQAAYTGPIVMMSQNRQDAKDRVRADIEYQVNVRAELGVVELHQKVDRMKEELIDLMVALKAK
jgi:uncharacterized membrane protein